MSYFHLSKKESNQAFLAVALRESNYLDRETLADLDSEDKEELIPKPRFPNLDRGPENVWRWAHQEQTIDKFVFSLSQIPLRQWE